MMHQADMKKRLLADMHSVAALEAAMPAAAAAFAAFPGPVRARLLEIRGLILATAAETSASGH